MLIPRDTHTADALGLHLTPSANSYYRLRVPLGAIDGAVTALDAASVDQVRAARTVVLSNLSSEPGRPVDTAAAMPAPRLESITDLRGAVSAYEKEILECALEKHRHNQRRTAAALNLTYDQLRHALKRHGLLGE